MLLKNCPNLVDLNLSLCTISDEAFSNVHLPRVQCCDCGNRRPKLLKLSGRYFNRLSNKYLNFTLTSHIDNVSLISRDIMLNE